MGESVDQVMEQCSPFNAIILDAKDTLEISSDIGENIESFDTKIGFNSQFDK